MDKNSKIDVIVVGAGPSGIACATVVARKGYKVLVIEKASDFGVKNMFGGAIYLHSIKELFPDIQIPYDREIVSHNYVILNNDNSLSVSYKNNSKKSAATITRFSFDTYLAENAAKEGVYFANNTLVIDLIKKDGKIAGVKTQNEEIYSDIVVLAEGFNAFLAEKIGLKKKTEPKDAILGVKEVIRLDKDVIEKRFKVKEKEGALFQIFGGLAKDNEEIPLGMGFIYTFKNHVTVGIGISMESLTKTKIKPHEYLERLKKTEFVSNLIEGGEVAEYSAHAIPEGGYNKIPKLYDNGVLLVGDAAGLVDAPHFEGTNLSIKSGILAGETIISAIQKKDFSKNSLRLYKKKLYKSYVVEDMKTYKSVISVLYRRRKSIFSYYPKKIDEFFNMFTSSLDNGKKSGYRHFILSFLKERNLVEIIKDGANILKCVIEAVL